MLSSFLFIPLAERSHRRVLSHLYPAALPARRRLRTVPSNLSRGQRKKSHVRRRRGDTGRQESYSTCRVLDTRQSLFLYSSRLLLLSSSRCAETCIKTRKKIAQNENSLGALRGWLLRRRFGADRSTSLPPPPRPSSSIFLLPLQSFVLFLIFFTSTSPATPCLPCPRSLLLSFFSIRTSVCLHSRYIERYPAERR